MAANTMRPYGGGGSEVLRSICFTRQQVKCVIDGSCEAKTLPKLHIFIKSPTKFENQTKNHRHTRHQAYLAVYLNPHQVLVDFS